MSSKPIDLDPVSQRLVDEGYRVEIREQYLLLHDVPYVTSNRTIGRGTLACAYVRSGNGVLPPDNHQVWWTGEYPCLPNGQPINQMRNEDNPRELFTGFSIRHRFSNKPNGLSRFPDYYSKLIHYVTLIQSQAKSLDSNVDAKGIPQDVIVTTESSPFVYEDSASARAEIQTTSNRLRLNRVAVVGVGGTGAYILDQLAKTPVTEIHIFDGDVFQQHNAFRAPGAATAQEIAKEPNKADYFKHKYEPMHQGIVSHPHQVCSENINELNGFDFVFVCVDNGPVRRLLFDHLLSQRTPFIDVGLNLHLVGSTGKLIGTCRFTLCTSEKNEHIEQYAPTEDDLQDAIYHQNIQIADMNALNAQLAVMRWKQYFGFYQDDFNMHNGTFSVNSMSLTRDVLG